MNIYEFVAIVIALISLTWTTVRWFSERTVTKENRRHQFFQKMMDGIFLHNWKFIEHWKENKGIRPKLDTTEDVEKSFNDFGLRVVTLDYLNFLWQVHVHQKILSETDIDAFRSWAKSWFTGAKPQLEVIFNDGDLYPLDYIVWLRDEIFKDEFNEIVGSTLRKRLQQYEDKQR